MNSAGMENILFSRGHPKSATSKWVLKPQGPGVQPHRSRYGLTVDRVSHDWMTNGCQVGSQLM